MNLLFFYEKLYSKCHFSVWFLIVFFCVINEFVSDIVRSLDCFLSLFCWKIKFRQFFILLCNFMEIKGIYFNWTFYDLIPIQRHDQVIIRLCKSTHWSPKSCRWKHRWKFILFLVRKWWEISVILVITYSTVIFKNV